MPRAFETESPITVVVTDTGNPAALLRCVRQLLKTSTGEVEIVVASVRHIVLPPAAARRVRKVRAGNAHQVDEAVAVECRSDRAVLVCSSSTSFAEGWTNEVRLRARLHPRAVSSLEAEGGGLLLFPAAVTALDTVRAPWLNPQGLRLRRAEGTSAHRTLAAVLIVKDEEDVLEDCLAAVEPFVDEVVVYDTGSSDSTRDIARRHGVTLVEGYWDDHFGNARNRALVHATSDWILQVDADEVVTGDVAELRALLDSDCAEQFFVTIVSGSWRGAKTGLETRPVRLFRRELCQYQGALHEFPVPRSPELQVRVSATAAPLVLLHSGYEGTKVAARDKGSRNVDLSKRELDEATDSADRASLLSNYGRSLMWAGRGEEALAVFEELRMTPGNPTAVVIAGRSAFDLSLRSRLFEQADLWLETLTGHGESAGNLAVMKARKLTAQGRLDEAEQMLEPLVSGAPGGVDPWATPFDPATIELALADLDIQRGDLRAATDRVLGLARTTPGAVDLNSAFTTFVAASRPLTDFAAGAHEDLLARSLREASSFHPSGALAWFEAFRDTHPDDHRPVVAGALFASRADWRTALTWAAHAREHGLEGLCPLRVLGERDSAPLLDRCVAWALLADVFDEAGAAHAFEDLTTRLSQRHLEQLMAVLAEVGIGTETGSAGGPAEAVRATTPVG